MRYEKPMVLNLGARARYADGQGPLSCYPGTSPGGYGVCLIGTGGPQAAVSCRFGPAPDIGPEACVEGDTPAYGFCMWGLAGDHLGDTCETGPAPA